MKAGGTISSDIYITICELALEQYKPPHLDAFLDANLGDATATAVCDWVLARKSKLVGPILKVSHERPFAGLCMIRAILTSYICGLKSSNHHTSYSEIHIAMTAQASFMAGYDCLHHLHHPSGQAN